MNDFEFQRYITIGQYLPRASIIHGLDPRARLVSGLLLIGAITAAPHLGGLGLAFVALVILTMLAQLPLGYILKGLIPPLPFIVFLMVLQILFGTSDDPARTLLVWGPIDVTVGNLISGAEILMRFAALILCISLLSSVTTTTEMVRGLEALTRPLARMGLPAQDFVLMVQIALRFLPLLAWEAERITKSQAARGADWGTGRGGLLKRVRQAMPMIVPLFLVSLQRAERVALAMEARGYQSQRRRTSLVTMHFRVVDAVALFLVGLLALFILWV